MKMEQIECSETSAYKIQTPGNHPEENIQHTEHGESLKSKDVFIHLVVCLTTGPKPLPKRAIHRVRSRASSFKWEYPLLFLRSSSSFLRLLPRLPVTSIPPFIFPLITRCRRQFLRKMWPFQFAFRMCIYGIYSRNYWYWVRPWTLL
jgi:hypothetical protein